MGNRIRLNSLLDDAKSTLEPEQEAATLLPADLAAHALPRQQDHAPMPPEVDAPVPTKTVVHAPRRPASRLAPTAPVPERIHYSSLVRKEARLRDDQIESLTLRARKLSRNKTASDQRITDNTLIRVAVDLLLAREADLSGTTEAELRQSLGL